VGQGTSGKESQMPAVPNVKVTIRDSSTLSVQTTQTDFSGNFRVEGLAPGRYEVSFAAKPFKQQVHTTNVRPGETVDASTRMLIGRDAEDIVGVSGCPARPVGGFPPPDLGKVEIQLRRTACYGSCPAYTVRLSGDGRVEYRGDRYVSILGVRNYRVDPSAVTGLAKKFYEKGFFSFCASYRVRTTDQPTVETAIHFGDVTKTVSVYGGKAPEGLEELQEQIEQTANVTQFVQSPDSPR